MAAPPLQCFTKARPGPPLNDKVRLSRNPGAATEQCRGSWGEGGTWLLCLPSSSSPYSSRGARRGTVKHLCKPRRGPGSLDCSPPCGPPNPALTPAAPPPFTGVGRVGGAGGGGRACEPSRLPEEQPGDRPEGHGPGSQDAGERAPHRSARGRNAEERAPASRRSYSALPRSLRPGRKTRCAHAGGPTVPPFPAAPAPESSGVAGGSRPTPSLAPVAAPPLVVPLGGGARSDASAVACAGAVAVGTAPWAASPALTPACRPGSPPPELPASSSTYRYSRIWVSCQGVHPTVASAGCDCRLLLPRQAPPGLRVRLSASQCMQLGENSPLTAV